MKGRKKELFCFFCKSDLSLMSSCFLPAVCHLCPAQDATTSSQHANTGTRTATNLARLRRLRQYSSNDETGTWTISISAWQYLASNDETGTWSISTIISRFSRTTFKFNVLNFLQNPYILIFLASMGLSFILKKIMVQAFLICVKLTNTQTEYKIIGWSTLDDIFRLFVLVGPPYCFSRTTRFF